MIGKLASYIWTEELAYCEDPCQNTADKQFHALLLEVMELKFQLHISKCNKTIYINLVMYIQIATF